MATLDGPEKPFGTCQGVTTGFSSHGGIGSSTFTDGSPVVPGGCRNGRELAFGIPDSPLLLTVIGDPTSLRGLGNRSGESTPVIAGSTRGTAIDGVLFEVVFWFS